jgi:ferredoxin
MRMTEVILLETINLKSSIEKAIEWLNGKTIFLDLPTNIEPYIEEIAEGADYQDFLQYMEDIGLIKVEERRKYQAYEPIFEYIYLNRPIVNCYEDPTHLRLSMDILNEIFILAAKGRLGWIDLERWRRVLEADRGLVKGGEIPPDRMFPLVRLSHVADSCVNCGQCQNACPMEIPLSKLYLMLNQELSSIFKYISGMNIEEKPPLTVETTDEELSIDDVNLFIARE